MLETFQNARVNFHMKDVKLWSTGNTTGGLMSFQFVGNSVAVAWDVTLNGIRGVTRAIVFEILLIVLFHAL